jgi:LacI family transcriptional regulator
MVPVAHALEEFGYDAALHLLAAPTRPTAIFASADLLALGVYRAAEHLGLRIPDDLAVVGFDDQEFAARITPPLTTLHLSYYDLGHVAARLLIALLKGSSPVESTMVEATLIVRGSSVSPAAVSPRGTTRAEVLDGSLRAAQSP